MKNRWYALFMTLAMLVCSAPAQDLQGSGNYLDSLLNIKINTAARHWQRRSGARPSYCQTRLNHAAHRI